MRRGLNRAMRIARRSTPLIIAAIAATLSLGAYGSQLRGGRLRPTFTASVKAKVVTVRPRSVVRLRIAIHRRRLRARVTFRVVSRPPAGMSVVVVPRRTRGRQTRLTIRTNRLVAPGRYRLRVRASAGRVRRTITLIVKVVRAGAGESSTGPSPPLTLSGTAANLIEPGAGQPIDVQVANPNALPVTVTGISVSLSAITAPHATATLPCSQSDFALTPYSGRSLTIPASSTRSLSALGIPSTEWPQISLTDLPTNQDGCSGASLSVRFGADARLG